MSQPENRFSPENLTSNPDRLPEAPSPYGPSDRDSDESEGHGLWFYGGIAAGVALLGLLLWVGVGGSGNRRGQKNKGKEEDESGLVGAKQALARQTDLTTCQSALNQLNSHILQNANLRPQPLSEERSRKLQGLFHLDQQELDEIAGTNFTPLDAYHLEQCLLFRDILQALEFAKPTGTEDERRATLLASATRAFAWSIRQVRVVYEEGLAVPPMFSLRLGLGSAEDRALVFLEILRQMGPPEEIAGCLIFCPDSEGKSRLWACGVVSASSTQIHLFDPRLGLPIPGPKGEGVATLAQAIADPSVLARVTVDPETAYDVTSEQAAKSEIRFFCPLSSLAPRIATLSDDLVPQLKIRAASDPFALQSVLAKACKTREKPLPFAGWLEQLPNTRVSGVGVMRRYLPTEEGGVDVPRAIGGPDLYYLGLIQRFDPNNPPQFSINLTRMNRDTLSLTPWLALPLQFKDPNRYPLASPLGQRVRARFSAPFLRNAEAHDGPRDLILRGHYSKAAPDLIEEYDQTQVNLRRLQRVNSREESEKTEKWLQQAFRLYADLSRAQRDNDSALAAEINRQIERHWGKPAEPLALLLLGAQAPPLMQNLIYLLAQCKHEQAERLQNRWENAPEAERAREKDNVQNAWRDALSWWTKYLQEHGDSPPAPHARFQCARVYAMLGRTTEAKAYLQDHRNMSKMEVLKAEYLTKQLGESVSRELPMPLPWNPLLAMVVLQPEPFRVEPRRVTLRGDAMSLSAVLKAFTKQTGVVVVDRSSYAGGSLDLNLVGVPTWEALDRIAKLVGAQLYLHAQSGQVFLIRRRTSKEWIDHRGPFRIELQRLTLSQDLLTQTKNSQATLQVSWEPWVRPFFLETRPQGLQILDDQDRAVPTSPSGHSLAPVDGRIALNFEIPLPEFSRKTQHLKRLAGQLEAIVPSKMLTFDYATVAKLNAAKVDSPLRQAERDGVACSVSKVLLTKTRWTIQVSLALLPSEVELESFQSWVVNNEMVLHDKAGRTWKSDAYVLDLNSPKRAVVSYHFLPKAAPSPAEPEQWSVRYTTPASLKRIVLPFEFEDIPLP